DTRRLVTLFKEALALPAVADATEPIDCVLCGADQTLTPQRVAFIRQRISETEAYQKAAADALQTLRSLDITAQAVLTAVAAACPQFLTMPSSERRARGFRLHHLRALLGSDGDAAIKRWLEALRPLAKCRTSIAIATKTLRAHIKSCVEDLDTLDDVAGIESAFTALAVSHENFSAALAAYELTEKPLVETLNAVIDTASDTTGWQDLIDLARDVDSLRATLLDRHARTALQGEL